MSDDIIIQQNGKWYFLDETWNEGGGPYDTKKQAEEELKRYISEELEGIPYGQNKEGL